MQEFDSPAVCKLKLPSVYASVQPILILTVKCCHGSRIVLSDRRSWMSLVGIYVRGRGSNANVQSPNYKNEESFLYYRTRGQGRGGHQWLNRVPFSQQGDHIRRAKSINGVRWCSPNAMLLQSHPEHWLRARDCHTLHAAHSQNVDERRMMYQDIVFPPNSRVNTMYPPFAVDAKLPDIIHFAWTLLSQGMLFAAFRLCALDIQLPPTSSSNVDVPPHAPPTSILLTGMWMSFTRYP